MQWIWLTLGLMLLMVAALLTMLLRRRRAEAFCRIPIPHHMLRRLRKTASLQGDSQDLLAVRDHALHLMEQAHRVHQALHAIGTLPASPDGEPRLMELARDTADAGSFTREALVSALINWEHSATPMEVSAFPTCVEAAQCQRLALVLKTIQQDARLRARAQRLAPRLLRSKKPYVLLEKAGLNSLGLAALAQAMRQQEQPEALVLLDRWLSVHDITAEVLAQQDGQRQLQLAEEIRRSEACFSELERIVWIDACAQADALHALLLKDPAGVYPSMDAASQLQLRCQAEMFSRHVHLDTAEVVRHALLLCEDAEPRALEQYIGFWLQDTTGCRALHRSLPTKKGWLHARFSSNRSAVKYMLLWAFGIAAGFGFLHSGQPVFMLPFFAVVVGDVIRLAVNRLQSPPLPRMAQDIIPSHVRTLVVLPALLNDPHEAIRMVRQLSIASHAIPQENVEFLLLGDFPPAMTAVSSLDANIVTAASSAVAALGDKMPIHYIQRGRVWDGDRHTYCARGGHSGAVTELCRLIVQGECADVIAYANVEPARFERRFDYIFVLSPQRPYVPGMLQRLLQTMTHPLCSRYPTGHGWRGFAVLSPDSEAVYDGFALLQPDAFLEATDGMVNPSPDANAILGELAGYSSIPFAMPQQEPHVLSWQTCLADARLAWRLLPWQLPWVKTPSGVINNPLPKQSRFRLREELRRVLLPLGQFALLLWAVLTQNWMLLLFALAAPELRHFSPRLIWLLQALCRLSLLPARMLVPLLPIWDALRHKHAEPTMTPSVEIWVQGLSATLYAALGLAFPGTAIPAFLMSVGFACFPLAHRILDAPVVQEEGLTHDHHLLLEDAAASTWRFFHTLIQPLPAAFVQFEPGQITASYTTPEAIGAYLLSCVCAKDLGYLSAEAAAKRLRQCLDTLQELPLPFGLPCRQYALPSLTVTDTQVDAASVGFLAAALMTAAQALRSWLPELPTDLAGLSAEAETRLASLNLSALYDETSGYFHAGLDAQGQPTGSIRSLADEGLLLVYIACARKLAPSDCLSRLSRTCVRLGKQEVRLSRHGAAAEHLLPGLFLPLDSQHARAYINAMAAHGQEGLFGQGHCHVWRFDAQLRYQQAVFGLPEAALQPVEDVPVFAPYAAALALPFAPRAAADALSRFCALGVKGPEGFCDAVDFTNGTSLVGLHDTFHQGLMMAALAHCLADAPIQRYFCALPEVAACLPLLDSHASAFVLPALPVNRRKDSVDDLPPSSVDARQAPVPMQVLGNEEFRLVTDAHGGVWMTDGDLPLNKAFHLYLVDEGRTYRLGDPLLQGEVHFCPGETRYEQLCGSLHCEVAHCTDTLRRRSLHVVTITNLSTRDRYIDVADCLLPDLSVPRTTLASAHPEPSRLTLHARGTPHTLHHTMSASLSPLSDAVCTDADVFIGRGGALHHPASLARPMRDCTSASTAPCLSFRSRYALGGRGQITLWFTVSLVESEPPQLTELPGIRQLAVMQDKAIEASAALTWQQRQAAQTLTASLQQAGWRASLLIEEPFTTVLADLLAIFGWLLLHGQQAHLRIHCTADTQEAITHHLHGSLAEGLVTFAEPNEVRNQLVLGTSSPLLEQLNALSVRVSLPTTALKSPIPAKLPDMELLYRGPYGGFDPETLDYVLQLEPGQLPPLPWTNLHRTRYFQEEADESGLRSPFHETVWLRMADGTLLSPWSPELPRSVRMRPGETDWEAWSDQLDLRLRAACLPGHRCAMRVLHIHNATDAALPLHITVTAEQIGSPLTFSDDVVMTDRSDLPLQSFLAGDGWHACQSIRSDGAEQAQLTCELLLEPHHSRKMVWLAGHARHGEDVARALQKLHAQSTSDLFRKVQTAWQAPLTALTFSTPESTLDLLLNRILPTQALNATGIIGIPTLMYIAPQEARRALLRQARHPMNQAEWAHFTLLMADYVRVTGDEALLHARIPAQDAPLLACCNKAVLSVPLDQHHLPQDDDQARLCFLYALAAQALDKLSPDPEAADLSRRLLNAADTYLWQDGYYSAPLRLDVQSLACAAYGANPRTRQAISTCWTTLYDEHHGLIRLRDADDSPPLPGLPENGGMVTLEAVHCLQALLKTARQDEAFELLRALNPLHHTDTPERQATFRCAPYQLHAGMCASPMEAGRAVPGGEEAAAMLYAVILADVLGIQLRGNRLRLKPCVPPDWDDFSFSLRMGTSTWHISAERRIRTLTVDGETVYTSEITLTDDGRVHQIRFPLT